MLNEKIIEQASKLCMEAEVTNPVFQKAADVSPMDVALGWIAATKDLVKRGRLNENDFKEALTYAAIATRDFHAARQKNQH
jgi:hypothetical protein